MSTESTDAFAPPLAEVAPAIDAARAGPWRRWLARNVDLGWQLLAITLTLGIVVGLVSPQLVDKLDSPGISQIIGIGAVLVSMVLDAALHRLFGNTPAKALLGVRVVAADGEPLTFAAHAGRNLRVWIGGLGLGIPLIALITMARQHGRVKAGKPATYDESSGHRVVATPVGVLRVALGILVYLGVTIGFAAVASGKLDLSQMIHTRGSEPPQSWTNPDTGLETSIEGFWKPARAGDPSGIEFTTFSEPLDQAVIVFACEVLEDLEIAGYVEAFRSATGASMKFDNEGSFVERNARPAWVCKGKLVEPKNMRFEVVIVHFDSGFWRTVKVQGMPTAVTDEITSDLCTALWTTVQ